MFTIKDVEKIAKLSSLELTEAEKVTFAKQFSTILEYFEILKTVEIPKPLEDRDQQHLVLFREDRSEPSSVTVDQFSPYVENGYFKVPKVIEPGN